MSDGEKRDTFYSPKHSHRTPAADSGKDTPTLSPLGIRAADDDMDDMEEPAGQKRGAHAAPPMDTVDPLNRFLADTAKTEDLSEQTIPEKAEPEQTAPEDERPEPIPEESAPDPVSDHPRTPEREAAVFLSALSGKALSAEKTGTEGEWDVPEEETVAVSPEREAAEAISSPEETPNEDPRPAETIFDEMTSGESGEDAPQTPEQEAIEYFENFTEDDGMIEEPPPRPFFSFFRKRPKPEFPKEPDDTEDAEETTAVPETPAERPDPTPTTPEQEAVEYFENADGEDLIEEPPRPFFSFFRKQPQFPEVPYGTEDAEETTAEETDASAGKESTAPAVGKMKRFFRWFTGKYDDGTTPKAEDFPPLSRKRNILRYLTVLIACLGIAGIAVICYEAPRIRDGGGFHLPFTQRDEVGDRDERTAEEKKYDLSATPAADFISILNEDGTATVASYTGNEETVIVPRVIEGHTVSAIGAGAFSYGSVRSVTCGKTVKKIGDNAFFGCDMLEEIVLPDTLEQLGASAFYGCVSLKQIELPDTLTGIPNYAFGDCAALTGITLPEELTAIGRFAFSGTGLTGIELPPTLREIGAGAFASSALEEIRLPEGLTGIREATFQNCASLKDITLPQTATKIEDQAFYHCTALREIRLPYGMMVIGRSAFSGCTALTDLDLPETVETLGDYAFYGCGLLLTFSGGRNLRTVGVRCFDETSLLDSGDYYLLIVGDGQLVKYFGNTTEIALPERVKVICEGAFENNASLETVYLPAGVTEIRASAFKNCTALQTITMSPALTLIGDDAFSGCEALTAVELPNGLQKLGKRAFSMCSSLIGISLPASLTDIPDEAFARCQSLSEIQFHNQVSIGAGAFASCPQLLNALLPRSMRTVGAFAFSGCTTLTTASLNTGLEVIGDFAFSGTALKKTTFPPTLTYAGENVFRDCPGLKVVYAKKGTYASDWANRHGL